MQVKTILNRVQKFQSFVYGKAEFAKTKKGTVLEVEIRPRANSQPVCSGCGKKRPGYDTLSVRRSMFRTPKKPKESRTNNIKYSGFACR